jgi:hypothetical protein
MFRFWELNTKDKLLQLFHLQQKGIVILTSCVSKDNESYTPTHESWKKATLFSQFASYL